MLEGLCSSKQSFPRVWNRSSKCYATEKPVDSDIVVVIPPEAKCRKDTLAFSVRLLSDMIRWGAHRMIERPAPFTIFPYDQDC